jgi:O6-methylguanine-DNA--protein-cysteine methyltransferase
MKAKDNDRSEHTHKIHLKMYNEFTGDISKVSLKTGNTFQQKVCLLVGKITCGRTRNYRWPHVTTVAEREKRWPST